MIRAVSVGDKETAVRARFRFPTRFSKKAEHPRSLHYRKRDITDHWNRRLLVTTHANSSLRRHLRTIFNEGTCAGLSDGQLLEQFATKTGTDAEPAFTLLIERHGPMVFRVCRSILRDLHEADDAFQATFLIQAGLADTAILSTLVEATTHSLTKAGTDANLVSKSVTLLTQTVLRTMFLGKLKVAVASLFIVGLAALSIGTFASGGSCITMTKGQTKTDVTKAVQRTEKAAGAVMDRAAPIAKSSSSRDDGSHLETITISGRAHDLAGQPVASATIYIINANRRGYVSDDRALSTVITGPDSGFVVHGVKLPIWKPDPGPVLAAEEGRFQVAGTASGFGFTWHEASSYRPVPRPPAAEIKPGANTAKVFYQDEPIQADLV
jgi:hypothetical protein